MILLISTEDNNCFSLAIGDLNKIVKSKTIEKPFRQSEMLLIEIDKLIGKRKIDGLIVVSGPGAFSGLRIGIATANALAYAWRAPITGVPVKKNWILNDRQTRLNKLWQAGVKSLTKQANDGSSFNFIIPEYGKEPNINKS